MKKLIIICLFTSILSFAQDDDRLRFYHLDGTEFQMKTKDPISVSTFLKNYFPEQKFTKSFTKFDLYDEENKTGILAIYYIEFTDKPLFVLGNRPSKNQIDKALKSFNFDEYQKNWEFDYNLKKYIKSGDLIIDDIYFLFGKPDKKTESSTITIMYYYNLNLSFTIKDYKVIDFIHSN